MHNITMYRVGFTKNAFVNKYGTVVIPEQIVERIFRYRDWLLNDPDSDTSSYVHFYLGDLLLNSVDATDSPVMLKNVDINVHNYGYSIGSEGDLKPFSGNIPCLGNYEFDDPLLATILLLSNK